MASFTPRETPAIIGRQTLPRYTIKQVYEGLLFEINKVRTSSLQVEDFNYWWQTAKDNYYKRRYALFFDTNQQASDDFRDISATKIFDATSTPPLDSTNERFPIPADYHHAIAVVVFFKVGSIFKNYKVNSIIEFPAERGNPGTVAMNLPDTYRRASFQRPVYMMRPNYIELVTGFHSRLALNKVVFSYLVLPEETILYTTDLDDPTSDPSALLLQPGVVTREILKEMVKLVLENKSDPRVGTKIQVDQALPQVPAQQQAAQATPQRR